MLQAIDIQVDQVDAFDKEDNECAIVPYADRSIEYSMDEASTRLKTINSHVEAAFSFPCVSLE